MIKRYNINYLKNNIKQKIITSVISLLIFIILIIIAIYFDIIILSFVSILFIVLFFILLILMLIDYNKYEKESFYQKVEEYKDEYLSKNNQLALIFSLFLNDVENELLNKGIRSVTYLNLNEEYLEVDVFKNEYTIYLTFKNKEVLSYTSKTINKNKYEETKINREKILFNNEKEIIDYIIEKYNGL